MSRCPDEVLRLIDHFDHQADLVRSPDYNEATLRIQFINPLFAALGWDIDNRQGFAPQYAEVVHEDRVKVAGARFLWIRAANNHGAFRRRAFLEIGDPWNAVHPIHHFTVGANRP